MKTPETIIIDKEVYERVLKELLELKEDKQEYITIPAGYTLISPYFYSKDQSTAVENYVSSPLPPQPLVTTSRVGGNFTYESIGDASSPQPGNASIMIRKVPGNTDKCAIDIDCLDETGNHHINMEIAINGSTLKIIANQILVGLHNNRTPDILSK